MIQHIEPLDFYWHSRPDLYFQLCWTYFAIAMYFRPHKWELAIDSFSATKFIAAAIVTLATFIIALFA